MKKVLVLYYSMYGHIERMAESVAEGARSVPGVEVTLAKFQRAHVAKMVSRMQ